MNVVKDTPSSISIFNILEIIIGISIPLIVVFVSYLLQKCRESKKERNRLLEIRQFIIYSLSSLNEVLKKSNKEIKELSSSINNPKVYRNEMPFFYELHTNLIDSIIPQDIYKTVYYLTEKSLDERNSNYLKFNNAIQFIKNLQTAININYDHYYSEYHRYVTIWNDSLQRVFDLRNELVINNKINGIRPSDDPFLKKIDIHTHKWPVIREEGDIFNSHKLFFTQLLEICNEFINDQRIERFDRPLTDANLAIINLKNIKKSYSDLFSDIYKKAEDVIKDIESVIMYLRL